MIYDILPLQDITFNHLCPFENFYFYFYFYFLKIDIKILICIGRKFSVIKKK
jgi:hypothetical protein